MIHLNMIVKNESAIIGRCLNSVFPHVDSWWIADTGSTDNTVEIIYEVAELHKLPGSILHVPFENFSQARNVSLGWVKQNIKSGEWGGYVLLMDADMELVVSDREVFEHLSAPAYRMAQH